MRTQKKHQANPDNAYLKRVNLAIDYVMSHLQEPLRLENVSRAAFLSPFHFHRVFQMLVGMTLGEFVKRRRLEKALNQMAHSKKPALTKVALECGFASSSDFSRCFKQQYGVAPSVFDIQEWQEIHRTELYAAAEGTAGGLHVNRLPAALNTDGFQVRLRELPARTVAYIRVMNPCGYTERGSRRASMFPMIIRVSKPGLGGRSLTASHISSSTQCCLCAEKNILRGRSNFECFAAA